MDIEKMKNEEEDYYAKIKREKQKYADELK